MDEYHGGTCISIFYLRSSIDRIIPSLHHRFKFIGHLHPAIDPSSSSHRVIAEAGLRAAAAAVGCGLF
jgi:hypothetical protein